jgi:hypothetical protein
VSAPSNIVLPENVNTSGGSLSLRLSSPFNLSNSVSTAGGNFELTGTEAIAISSLVKTDGGNITLSGASIDTSTGTLDSTNLGGNGGAIAFSTTGNITTGILNFGNPSGTANNPLSINTSGIVNLNGEITTNGGGHCNWAN